MIGTVLSFIKHDKMNYWRSQMANILVVDDDDDIRETLVDYMNARGHHAWGAGNGREAIDMVAKEHPDLLITDIIMPEKDGIQMIIETRKKFGDIPIIAMSGGGRIPASVYLAHAKALKGVKTLEKPFKVTALLKAVNELVNGAAGQ
jgi:DNA-binding NtrC family response regulator